MNFIERLLTGAIKKNISAKPKIGNYSIDIEYINNGVKYIIMKNYLHIATVTKELAYKNIIVELTEVIEDSDMDRVHSAVEHCFKDCQIKIL